MEETRSCIHSTVWAGLALCVLVAGIATPAFGAEPTAELEEDSTATLAGLSVYTVVEPNEVEFLQALVENSGYVGFQPGFANERVIRSLANDTPGEVTYLVLTRHYSRYGMYRTLEKRDAAVLPFLTQSPEYVPMELEEHQVPNWGWERSQPVSFTRIGPGGNPAVFNEYGTSLSFFKYGYTGQTAVVKAFPSSATLDDVQQALFAESGLAGASIFRNSIDDSLVVYAEYFETPASYASARLSVDASGDSYSGAEAGVVVENYKAR